VIGGDSEDGDRDEVTDKYAQDEVNQKESEQYHLRKGDGLEKVRRL